MYTRVTNAGSPPPRKELSAILGGLRPPSARFIYQPRSGDRVISLVPSTAVAVLRYPNGSRHVLGGVTLQYHASKSGEEGWWRDRARVLAAGLVDVYGGIAWDDCGTVCLTVPHAAAWAAHELMCAAGRTKPYRADSPAGIALLTGGAARMVRGPYGPQIDQSSVADIAVKEVTITRSTPTEQREEYRVVATLSSLATQRFIEARAPWPPDEVALGTEVAVTDKTAAGKSLLNLRNYRSQWRMQVAGDDIYVTGPSPEPAPEAVAAVADTEELMMMD